MSLKIHLKTKSCSPLWYFVYVQECYTYMCHLLRSLDQNRGEWIEGIAPTSLNSLSWELLITWRTKWPFFYYISTHLPHESSVKPWNDHFNLNGSPAAHTRTFSSATSPPVTSGILTAIEPKMPVDLFAKNKSIPFYGCALQFMVFCIFADSESLPLAVMVYEQYKAISKPLAIHSQHVQQSVLPAHGWGLHGGNGRWFDTHNSSVPLMLLWV